ncbi:MAG TPA: glycerol kinase GlpK [Dehalococcoidia bacterium]
MPDAVLAIDAGTTGVTSLLVGHDGAVLARGYREFPQHYPRPGWVEHDAEEIWQATLAAAADALAHSPEARPIAVGITNQRETFLFWDRASGRPLHNAIVWQCRRSAAICDELRAAGLEPEVRRKTGLLLDPYFSGTKALWLTRERPDIAGAVRDGSALFGTVDTWLAWKLTGGRAHVTDYTNACRTLAFDIDRLDWDDDLLAAFGLDLRAMPEAGPSGRLVGQTVASGAIAGGLPLASLVGDQQAALFGQACFDAGQAKATYGTGCFILMNTGPRRVDSQAGLLTTLAASSDGRAAYASEGSIFIAGAAIQWCRDNVGFIREAGEAERLAASVRDSGGVVFVPAFVGLGTPYWGPDARGAIFGLTRGTEPAHIVRAAVESMAYQAQDVLDIMTRESGLPIQELRVDGGAAANDFLMQLQADLSGAALSRPQSVESTAMGAAFLAGIATGFWRDAAEVASLRREERRFVPSPEAGRERGGRERWRAAVDGLLATKLAPFDDNPDT